MSYNKVVLVGRPNVGKSSIFNIFSVVHKSIVMNAAGTTRNFVESGATFRDLTFNIVDTPGYESKYFYESIANRYQKFLRNPKSLILFVVDNFSELDKEILNIVRTFQDRVLLVVNKCDLKMNEKYDFLTFGLKTIFISASHKSGFDELYLFFKSKELSNAIKGVDLLPTVAIIGRPNTGKSTFINKLVQDEILITGEEAGLTTDSIKVNVDDKFILVDTAGIRRRSLIKNYDEKEFVKHSLDSLRQSDIVCIMIDAYDSITMQDARLINLAYEAGKGVILLINKCDLLENIRLKEDEIYEKYPYLNKCKIFFITALSLKSGFKQMLYEEVSRLYKLCFSKFTTNQLNKWVEHSLKDVNIARTQKMVKYAVQINDRPLTIKLFYSNPKVHSSGYLNFIYNSFYKYFNFYGVGVKIQLFKKKNPFL